MKSLLTLLLIGAIAFLAYQNHEKELSIARLAAEASQSEEAHKLSEAKDRARAAGEERDKLKRERDGIALERDAIAQERTVALAERDSARQEVVAARAEIARLTQTTPKPASWLEKRIEQSSNPLDPKGAPSSTLGRPRTIPGQR